MLVYILVILIASANHCISNIMISSAIWGGWLGGGSVHECFAQNSKSSKDDWYLRSSKSNVCVFVCLLFFQNCTTIICMMTKLCRTSWSTRLRHVENNLFTQFCFKYNNEQSFVKTTEVKTTCFNVLQKLPITKMGGRAWRTRIYCLDMHLTIYMWSEVLN